MTGEVGQPSDGDPVMQTRCPHCGGEQYSFNVVGFSTGQHGCTVCGKPSKPMTRREWYSALKRLREKT